MEFFEDFGLGKGLISIKEQYWFVTLIWTGTYKKKRLLLTITTYYLKYSASYVLCNV